MTATYGLKLSQGQPSAKAISLIRKQAGLSIAEIKEKTTSDSYIISCECSDDNGLRSTISLYEELEQVGVVANPFWHDKPEEITFFKNTLDAHTDTARELGILDEEE